MKNKKLLLLIIVSLFILTGCSTVVNVDIKQGEIKENIEISMMSSNYNVDNIYEYVENELFEVEYDSEIMGYFKLKNNVNSNPLKAYRVYQISEYESDLLLNRCFDKTDIDVNNNILTVKAEGFNCYSKYDGMGNITINLNSTYNVISNNADINFNGRYTWYINRGNNTNDIEISIDLGDGQNTIIKNKNNIYLVFIPFFLLLILGLIKILKKKIKNNNEI